MFIPANDDQTAVVHYSGSLRDALHTGNQREVLGFCGSGPDWTTGYESVCTTPHDFQVLASGVVGGGDISHDELQRTCVQVAQKLTALPDVTAAGALAIEVQSIENTGASFDVAGRQVAAKLGCGIGTAGSRRLAGSLVALGDLPIPGRRRSCSKIDRRHPIRVLSRCTCQAVVGTQHPVAQLRHDVFHGSARQWPWHPRRRLLMRARAPRVVNVTSKRGLDRRNGRLAGSAVDDPCGGRRIWDCLVPIKRFRHASDQARRPCRSPV